MDKMKLKDLRKDFWDALRKQFRESGTSLRPGNSRHGHWLLFKIGVVTNAEPTQQNFRIMWSDDGNSFRFEVMFYGQPKFPLTKGKYHPGYSREWFCFFNERLHRINEQLTHKVKWMDHMPIEVGLRTADFDARIGDRVSWPGYIEKMIMVSEELPAAFDQHASCFKQMHLNG